MCLSFPTLKGSKGEKIKGLKQIWRMRRKCNQSDVLLCKQLLDFLINMRTSVVAKNNNRDILEFHDLSGRFDEWNDDADPGFCENRASHIHCMI
jgi:hypothetical protein